MNLWMDGQDRSDHKQAMPGHLTSRHGHKIPRPIIHYRLLSDPLPTSHTEWPCYTLNLNNGWGYVRTTSRLNICLSLFCSKAHPDHATNATNSSNAQIDGLVPIVHAMGIGLRDRT